MKKFLLTLVSLSFAVITSSSFAGKGNTALIVHKPATPAEQVLEIPEQALDGHIRHGDFDCDNLPDPETPPPGVDPELLEAVADACEGGVDPE